jgi:hypothetical protein
LNTEEIMDVRMRGALPRASALRHVQEKHDVNTLACVCAIDRATLLALTQYWAPGVNVAGVTEMVANALVMDGEKEVRDHDLRDEPYLGVED